MLLSCLGAAALCLCFCLIFVLCPGFILPGLFTCCLGCAPAAWAVQVRILLRSKALELLTEPLTPFGASGTQGKAGEEILKVVGVRVMTSFPNVSPPHCVPCFKLPLS